MTCSPNLERLHCFQWEQKLLASSQSFGSVDADAWCKRALTVNRGRQDTHDTPERFFRSVSRFTFIHSEGSIRGELSLTFASKLDIVDESKVISEVGDLFMSVPVLMPNDVSAQVTMETPMYRVNDGQSTSGSGK